MALNSTLELREVLKLLGEMALQATRADRCSVFLLDGHWLRPVAIGTESDDGVWNAFQAMGPIDLRVTASAWPRLAHGRPVTVRDVRTSDLIPSDWVERFSLRSVILVPLVAAGEPRGLLTLEYASMGDLDAADLDLLASIGVYAAIAVTNARAFEPATGRASVTPEGRRGLVSAVHDLTRSFAVDSAIQILVEVRGKPARLDPDIERALYRVAHEAIASAWRHSRCAIVRLELVFAREEVLVRVRDDGVGLGARGADRGIGLAIIAMRRAVVEVNGTLHVRNVVPRGVLVEAAVPRGAR